jgi:hypothetical protein
MGGRSIGPVILIRPYLREDYGIYRHELVHVIQWLVLTLVTGAALYFIHPALVGLSIGTFGALHRFVPKFRLWAEVQAYREQAKHYKDDRVTKFAGYLADSYDLDITTKEAEIRLRKGAG